MKRTFGMGFVFGVLALVVAPAVPAQTIVEDFTGTPPNGVAFDDSTQLGGVGAIIYSSAGNPLPMPPSPGSGGTYAGHGGLDNPTANPAGAIGTFVFDVKNNASGNVYVSFNVPSAPTGLSRYTAVYGLGEHTAAAVLGDISDGAWNSYTVIGEYSNSSTGGVWITRNAAVNTGSQTKLTVALVFAVVIGSAPDGAWDDIALDDALIPGTGPDADSDGVPDSAEGDNLSLGAGQSNMILSDSDGDGLLDGAEDANRNGSKDANETSTRNRDTDGDNFEDGVEVLLGQNPLVANGGYTDADGDGLPDSIDPNSGNKDTDSDRFDDGFEAAWFQDAGAANDGGRIPPLADANGDGNVSNLDALVTQALFLGVVTYEAAVFDTGPAHVDGFRYTDTNRDGTAGNLDALIAQTFFLNNLATLPLRL